MQKCDCVHISPPGAVTPGGNSASLTGARTQIMTATTSTSQAEFRNRYRAEEIGGSYSGPLHFATTIVLSSAAIVAALLQVHEVAPLEWLTVPIAFLYANLVEYVGHRGPMHNRTRGLGLVFKRHTLQHHRFFTNDGMQFDSSDDYKAVLFPVVMVVFFFAAFGIPAMLILAWLATPNVAYLFIAVAVAYFLNYEILHFAYHTPEDSRISRLPGMNRLRRLHTTHHDPALMQRYNINIKYPICDWVFGTLHRG